MTTPVSIFWFRRDLRLHDNAGLYHALKSGLPVLPIFIFDEHILDDLSDRQDARVTFIHRSLQHLKEELEALGSTLWVFKGRPDEVWTQLLDKLPVGAVYTNHDFEPYAIRRDEAVADLLAGRNIPFLTFKDHVIFEKTEVLKSDGLPYTVFTPYSKKWLEKLHSRWSTFKDEAGEVHKISFYLKSYPNHRYFDRFVSARDLPYSTSAHAFPSLEELGFSPSPLSFPPAQVARGLIRNYDKTRDIPGIQGTSRLGIHFRFGTISIREKAWHAMQLNATYLNELIWRDFYSQILAHFPHVVGHPFRAAYDQLEWRNAPEDFEKWKAGKTGYPIVDAGMRELNATGYMHNRVRMITASFLSKHLLLDWRLGEAYFAEKLLDYDLASNSGGWQWAAGCGTDAAPYFRIFNPTEQTKKFDPQYQYIRKWVPEFGTPAYPRPMVEHTFARERCLKAYKKALKPGE
ncbi:MAG: deoxyribodipyrimidine photo-lyase [Saprospiraceae bacterium]|nr:deoxyribodipyrimidine photo-lyase [Saprospiraceae bacterium]